MVRAGPRRLYPPRMHVVLPDGRELALAEGATGRDAAASIGERLGRAAVALAVDGEVRDLRLPLREGEHVRILTDRDPEALDVLRHSAAHVMAQAVLHLFPDAKIAIGPPIADGFYYDFEFPHPIGPDDLERIEAEMRRILASEHEFVRVDGARKDDVVNRFRDEGQPYKAELAAGLPDGEISFYRHDDFEDLCRGPHLQTTAPIKAFKLLSVAGAYWRGDAANPMLTRIYGTAFFSKKDLEAYLQRLEEARRRDHRRLGRELDLFHFDEHSPGSPLWHPRGMVLWNGLEQLRQEGNRPRGYLEVKTPLLYDTDVWRTSGHWDKYREHMFLVPGDGGERAYGLKPMNCPGHMLLFGSQLRSYRDLPLRFAEASTLHRDEPTGTLHGLLRVRHVTQDDAHIFCAEEHIEAEVFACLDYANYLYGLFGMEARAELSTRPDDRLGSDEQWDVAEAALRSALDRAGREYAVNEGDGAFYGPKIDLHMTDVLGRSWQMGTIQLDYQMPARFGLRYVGADNAEHTPVVIHRALLGSLERFIGILIEHFAGAFPLWLAPVQAEVVPVADRHHEHARAVVAAFDAAGLRAGADLRGESMGKKIAEAEHRRVPYILVVGDREAERGEVSVRVRGQGNRGAAPLADVVVEIADLHRERALALPAG
jgi:threonyl-tRNA synthetase